MFYALLAVTFAIAGPVAAQTWYPYWTSSTGGASNSFFDSSKWTPWWPDNWDAAATINSSISGGTQLIYVGGDAGFYSLTLGNGGGTGTNKVLLNSNHFQMNYGTVNAGGIIEVGNSASMTWWRGGQINSGGTITISSSGTFRYDGQSDSVLDIYGTMAGGSSSSGTAWFHTHGFGSGNNNAVIIQSAGRVMANSGSFYFDTRSAWDQGGLTIASGGTLQVNADATFILNRASGAWSGGAPNLTNQGTIYLAGGSLTLYSDGSQSAAKLIWNNGLIVGSGTLAASVKQTVSGQTIASNGILNLYGTFGSDQATFTSSGGEFGTFKAESGGTLKALGDVANTMSGKWWIVSGGTLEIASSKNVDLGNAYLPGSNLAGVVKMNSGANLTLSVNSTIGGQTVEQAGKLDFAGGSIFAGNNVGGAAFTNKGAVVVSATGGTLQTGYGTVGIGANYSLINTGWITNNTSGAALHLRTGSAGLSNSGTIYVGSGAVINFAVVGSGTAALTNVGTLILAGGTAATRAQPAAGGADSDDFTRQVRNVGTITGQGTLAGTLVNVGTVRADGGTLQVAGTGALTQAGTLDAPSGATLLFSNAAGRVSFNNTGMILMGGGTLIAGTLGNTASISGFGTIEGGGVSNASGGFLFALTNGANAGTLTVRVTSFTNLAGSTVGTIGTNAVLNLLTPGGVGVLINYGTVSISGGTIQLNGASGTITNFNTIAGVGNVAALPIVNMGGASFVAQNPVAGLDTLTASVSATNEGLLAANSGATLSLTVSGTADLVNANEIALRGGWLTLGGSIISNISGGIIYGSGLQTFRVENLAGGVILASNGVLGLGLTGVQTGTLSNYNASATLRLTNAVLANTGRIYLSGGGLLMAGSVITNTGTMTGPGDFGSSLYNAAAGTVEALSGTLRLATNGAAEFVNNLGTFTLGSGGTLHVTPDWNSSGTITLGGGTLAGGILTNAGAISGAGSINNDGLIVTAGGTVDIGSGETLRVVPAWSNVAGVVTLNNGTLAGGILNNTGTVIGQGTITAPLGNAGATVATNGTLTLSVAPTQTGTITVANVATLNVGAAWNNNGTLALRGGTVIGSAVANAGRIRGAGSIVPAVNNTSSLVATNGALFLTAIPTQSGTMTVTADGALHVLGGGSSLANSGTLNLLGGTFTATNLTYLANTATISGFGALHTGRTSGSGGANAYIVNTGTIVATGGDLLLNVGDAYFNGGFSNAAAGTMIVVSGAALQLNRTAAAWNNLGVGGNTNPRNLGTVTLQGGTFALFSDGTADAARFVDNVGTISGQGTLAGSVTNQGTILAEGGTLNLAGTGPFRQAGLMQVNAAAMLLVSNASGRVSFNNAGSILMNGGTLAAGFLTNANLIFGRGTITGDGVLNNASLYASNGVLTVSLASFTNVAAAVAGTLSTNGLLNILLPGGVSQPLINEGLINMAGGTLTFHGGTGGVITNTGRIIGVGTVVPSVANSGTIMAANPVAGLSVFSVGLEDFNSATLGASNGAVLNVIISGGSGQTFHNLGTIAMLGGTLRIQNGTPGLITNSNFITGHGTVAAAVVNLTAGTILASNGVLTIGLHANVNFGTLSNFNASAAVELTNTVAVNQGKIFLSGGLLAGAITNQNTITGAGFLGGALFNDTTGLVLATNGTLRVATNAGAFARNTGTFTIKNDGTLDVSPAWLNTNGTVTLEGGTLAGGILTNQGLVSGLGTITSVLHNTATGTVQAVGGDLFIRSSTISQLGTMIGGATGSSAIIITNLNANFVNRGTLLFNSPAGGHTNLAFKIWRESGGSGDFTNAAEGVMRGAGYLATGDFQPGGQNFTIWNRGQIIATNGALILQPGDVFGNGGFVNQAGGSVTVAEGATFGIQRSANAWTSSGTVPANLGVIELNGGTFNFYSSGLALVTDQALSNVVGGVVRGFGTVNPTIHNFGTVIATNGLLTMNSSTRPRNFGTLQIENNATLMWNTLAPWQNDGTIVLRGGTLRTGGENVADLGESFTNTAAGVIRGFGTLLGGGRAGGSGLGYDKGIVNLGTIIATNMISGTAQTLVINTGVATTNHGIANLGTMIVTTNMTLNLVRETGKPIVNAGTILLRDGTLATSGLLTNAATGLIRGMGTISSSVLNAGTLLANGARPLHLTGSTVLNQDGGFLGGSNGYLIVDTIFTNRGTFSLLNSVGTFSSRVVNEGAFQMDPSTVVFHSDLEISSSGSMTMTAGDVAIFHSNLVNRSTQNLTFNTLAGKFQFAGDGGHTQTFFVAGLDLGGDDATVIGTPSQTNSFLAIGVPLWGYTNNFALGTLEIGNAGTNSTLMLADTFLTIEPTDGQKAGLYVNQLIINPGSLLIISNNVELYYKQTNGVTGVSFGTLNPGDNVLILGNGSFHHLNVVPEPNVLMLLIFGGVGIYWWRRRRG